MSKDARTLVTLVTLVAAFILPAYHHAFSVSYLSNECSTFAAAPLQSKLCNAISAPVYGMDAHRLQGEVDVGTGRMEDFILSRIFPKNCP